MRPGTAKAKGTATETAFVNWMQQWVPHIERRRLSGAYDRGDITGLPGVVIEVKSGAKPSIPKWLRELNVEMENDNADMGAVVVRPKGFPKPQDWYALMPVELFKELVDTSTIEMVFLKGNKIDVQDWLKKADEKDGVACIAPKGKTTPVYVVFRLPLWVEFMINAEWITP